MNFAHKTIHARYISDQLLSLASSGTTNLSLALLRKISLLWRFLQQLSERQQTLREVNRSEECVCIDLVLDCL